MSPEPMGRRCAMLAALCAMAAGCGGPRAAGPVRANVAPAPARAPAAASPADDRSVADETSVADDTSAAAPPPVARHVVAIDERGVWDVLLDHDAEVRACYVARGLAADVARDDTAVLTFRVGPNGAVIEAKSIALASASPRMGARQMEAIELCIAHTSRSWVFPSPGPDRVAYLTCRLPVNPTTYDGRNNKTPRRRGQPEFTRTSVPEEVKRIFAPVKACYERGLEKIPTLNGKIETRWTIDLDGSVPIAQVASDTVGDADVAECVTRRIVELRFSQWLREATDVVFPFVFQR